MDTIDAARMMAANCLCFRSRRLARLITRAYDEALRPLGLEATQLTLLNAVALSGSTGCPMRRLADALAIDLSTLSRNLKPLESCGAITVGRLDKDRRVRIATLTSEGRALLDAAWPLWRRAHERLSDVLGPEATDRLRQQLDGAAAATAAAPR